MADIDFVGISRANFAALAGIRQNDFLFPMIPVLLDTDPGNDIDDVLAIAYLLKQPRCEFLGITTATGDVARRAALAEVICRAVGRNDVPIVAGRSEVLVHGPGQPHVPQYEAIRDLPHSLDYPADQAVRFLQQKIRERPGEIVLLTIAPLPNIALLFGLDPEIPSLLRGIVSMAGAFFGHNNLEWNCRVDPVATAMVAATKRSNHTWYGLDVTMQVLETPETVRTRYKAAPLDTILPMAEIWFQGANSIVYHDPLAAACIFEQDLCKYDEGKVLVSIEDGKTAFSSGQGQDRVATDVDAARFFEHFYSVLGLP
jgi:purine nucleosidase